ncbi:MAG: hypothetical protein LBL69_05475 [Zoogloeaceae bacterium]|nr:hypothetical protein [Zoogloeaceae bacterium]
MPALCRWFPLFVLALALSGCAGLFRADDTARAQQVVTHIESGDITGALYWQGKSGEGRLLQNMDLGQLRQLQGEIAQSRDHWRQADAEVEAAEDAGAIHFLAQLGAVLWNDRLLPYEGQDYEKVFVSTQLTLNDLLLGDAATARVDMKRTVEREKRIEAARDAEYDELEKEADERQIDWRTADIAAHGYPMAPLDAPEVRALKNGFQNALSHYLAGWFFENAGEPSLAAPGYRNAYQLRPGNALIQKSLSGMGKNRPPKGTADTLFIIETGFVPPLATFRLSLPIRVNGRWFVAPVALPVIGDARRAGALPASLAVGGKAVALYPLVDVDAMVRRSLKDRLPAILLRALLRTTFKSAAQYGVQGSRNEVQNNVAGIITALLAVSSEQADERLWRTLPGTIGIARANLPAGMQTLSFGGQKTTIRIGPGPTLVVLRLAGDHLYVLSSAALPTDSSLAVSGEKP